jgi:hypothetical protein
MSSFGGKVLTGSVLAVIGLITVKIVLALVSGFMVLMSFLLFTVLPILLIGWLVLRLIKYLRSSEKPAME